MSATQSDVINKVKASKLLTLDLESWIDKGRIADLDISVWLHMGLVLREQPFREAVDREDWERFRGKLVRLHCSTDAILPTWAWILASLKLRDVAEFVHVGTTDEFLKALLTWRIRTHDWSPYRDRFVILKGCSGIPVHESVYALAAMELSKYAKKILYGEACSNVPLFRS